MNLSNLTKNYGYASIDYKENQGVDAVGCTSLKTVPFNTINVNTIAGLSLSGSQVTVPVGRYFVTATWTAWASQHYMNGKLYNVTDATYEWTGKVCSAQGAGQSGADSSVGSFVLEVTGTPKVFEFRVSGAAEGRLGVQTGQAGFPEIYSGLTFIKIG